ncbi:hypothetical protein DMA12_46615 [Amycolatopsis balhimycina DSM 5908]|uniref:Uncharacterized protein n=1 Tax=Amycolatopsis balhimycina DSM 5908 TaxID=1081091 RepID=A0A428VVP4_AMYBA|nr:hypothetical protein [Amycolatopsis balhimycina]RSM34832.1 hypothetical protein DMA12_46615 [Amycolatopsis balhimycina DSM 5908]
MLVLEPVIDAADATGFTLWPVTARAGRSLIRVSAGMSPLDVGTVIAALHPRGSDASAARLHDAVAVLRAIIEADCLIAAGGLLARDTLTGVAIPPSCCCGLESWREWTAVPHGGQPWLGHSPAPWVEHLGNAVRIWPDGGLGEAPPPIERAITAPLDVFAAQLHTTHQDLLGFLDAATQWAHDFAPGMAGDLAAKLDDSFAITER